MAKLKITLTDSAFQRLGEQSIKLALTKDAIIERALSLYFDQNNRAEYVQSFVQSVKDMDLLKIAEEGMEDYFNQLQQYQSS